MVTYVVGHANPDTDAVCAAIGYAELRTAHGDDAVPAIQGEPNPETEYVLERFGLETPAQLSSAPDGESVALVDHSDRSQAPDGLEADQLIAVVDHHRVGDIQTTEPIFYLCAPVGSTATLVAELFDYHGETPTDSTRGCLLCAILSDTLAFQSPTTTDRDKQVGEQLADELGVDIDDLAADQLRAKADLSGATPAEVLRRDMKTYDTPRGPIAVSQVELPDGALVLKEEAAYREAMAALREGSDEVKYHGVMLAVTDLGRGGSSLLLETVDPAPYEAAFDVDFSDVPYLPGVLSRKRQLMPQLLAALED